MKPTASNKSNDFVTITENELDSLFASSPIGIVFCTNQGKVTKINKVCLDMLGSNSLKETMQINLLTFLPLIKCGFSAKLAKCFANKSSDSFDIAYISKWGKELNLKVYIVPFDNGQDELVANISVIEINKDLVLKDTLSCKEERLQIMLKGIPSPAWLIDKEYTIIDQNDASEKLFQKRIGDRLDDEVRGEAIVDSSQIKNIEKPFSNEIEVNKKIWNISWIPIGGKIFLCYGVDVTKYKKIEKRLLELSNTDQLTGLKNRYFLYDIFDVEINNAEFYNSPLSIILIDLDFFKFVNDSYGHPIGDAVLKHVASIMQNSIRKTDTLIRMGGEEFLVLLPRSDKMVAKEIAERMRLSLASSPHPIAGKITASFGVTSIAKDDNLDLMYKRADEALYRAKGSGRNCVVCYDENTIVRASFASASLNWNSELESGDLVVDEQHKNLIEIANRLLSMAFVYTDKKVVEEQLTQLKNAILEHFDYEEKVQEKVHYPDVEKHRKLHKQLKNKINAIFNELQEGRLKPSEIFAFMLDEVVIEHMEKEDVKFFPYIKAKLLTDKS